MNTEYHYHIEDGQFTKEIYLPKLIGNEGDIKRVEDDDFGEVEFYILYVDGNYVECIGNVHRDFPKNFAEHENLKNQMKLSYNDTYNYFNITYTQEFSNEIFEEKIVNARTVEEAKQIFSTDYPQLNIVKIEIG